MKFRKVSTALVGLHNWARQDPQKATDYQIAFGVKSTESKAVLAENIAIAKEVLPKIDKLCDPKLLAILRIYFGFHDIFNKDSEYLKTVSEIAYADDIEVGGLIKRNWRDSIRVDNAIAEILDIHPGTARHKIINGKIRLNSYKNQFVNLSYPLAREIEELLIEHDLLVCFE